MRRVVIALGLALLGAACDPKRPDACAPQETQACTCTTGSSGTQICLTDGTWGACSCAVGDAGFAPYGSTDASRMAKLDARTSSAVDAGTNPH